jgi:hypothetical protein
MRKLFLLFILSVNVYSFELPNKEVTSGDYDTLLDKKTLCVPNYTSGKDEDGNNVRHVPQKIKNIVFQEYGILKEDRSNYVIDHLVNLSNGGLNNLYNLWPQPKEEGHKKDRLENKLHKMVCNGEISLKEAQEAIKDNWVVAYSKYVEEE